MIQVSAATSPAKQGATDAERSEAARAMGRARTPAKSAVGKKYGPINGLMGGRPEKPLSEIECRCGADDALTGHKWDCPRGQAIKRRMKAGTLAVSEGETTV